MKKSYLWSALFALAIGGWFASGHLEQLGAKTAPEPVEPAASGSEPAVEKPFRVVTQAFDAISREQVYPVRGLTEASQRVEVRARTGGIVADQRLDTGDAVKKGDVLCQLDMAAREAQLARAKAQLASAKRNYEATDELARKQYAARSKLASDKAAYELALAEVRQIELDMGWTAIEAPVDGVLVDKPAQAGALLQQGGLCATVTVLDPLLVTAQVPERIVSNLKKGMRARASLATGQTVSGTISNIALSADPATRTFRVELSVPNADGSLREGVTSELLIALPPVSAHLLPSSALTLSDDGRFGVRVVDADSRARFAEVKLLQQDAAGTWVAGLPDKAEVIVTGQDFVRDGQTVEAVRQVAGTGS